MSVCQTLSLSHLDRPDNYESWFLCAIVVHRQFLCPCCLTSSPVVIFSVGLDPHSFGDLVTQWGGVPCFGFGFGVGLGVVAPALHSPGHCRGCFIPFLLSWARGESVPTYFASRGCGWFSLAESTATSVGVCEFVTSEYYFGNVGSGSGCSDTAGFGSSLSTSGALSCMQEGGVPRVPRHLGLSASHLQSTGSGKLDEAAGLQST